MRKTMAAATVALTILWMGGYGGTQQKPKAGVFWKGTSGGLQWQWTEKDIQAQNAQRGVVYSVRKLLLKERGKADELDPSVITTLEADCKVCSVTGSLLCYERDSYWDGGAHPSGSERFVVVDVAHPRRKLKLTDLFPDADVRDALLADKIVQHVRKREGSTTPPKTSAALVKQLEWKMFGGDSNSEYAFPDYLLESFAFHHIENGQVAVRFCLSHASEIYRFQHTQIGILLPIPARLKATFERAASRQEGLLMQDAARIAKDASTQIEIIHRSEPK